MSAATAAGIRGRENTRSRFTVSVPSSAAVVVFVSPAHAGRTTTNSHDLASVLTVAGDDPVNESDPSGDFPYPWNGLCIKHLNCPPTTVGPNGEWTIIKPTGAWSANVPNDNLYVFTPFIEAISSLSSGEALGTALADLWFGVYPQGQPTLLTDLQGQAQDVLPSHLNACETGVSLTEFQCSVSAILQADTGAGTGQPGIGAYSQFLQDNEESLAYLVFSFNQRLQNLYNDAADLLEHFYLHIMVASYNINCGPTFIPA